MNALIRGVIAGAVGAGVMTGYQLAVAKAQGKPLSTPVPDKWSDAPAPAQVAKKLAGAVGQGKRVKRRRVPLVTNVVHWLYGIGLGSVYGVTVGRRAADPLVAGAEFGAGAWTASYVELVPLGIYRPPWKYPLKVIALELSYHLAYGLSVAGAYALLEEDHLERLRPRRHRRRRIGASLPRFVPFSA
jgi:uncharacterized membrane protein YagU involved in acid resistance